MDSRPRVGHRTAKARRFRSFANRTQHGGASAPSRASAAAARIQPVFRLPSCLSSARLSCSTPSSLQSIGLVAGAHRAGCAADEQRPSGCPARGVLTEPDETSATPDQPHGRQRPVAGAPARRPRRSAAQAGARPRAHATPGESALSGPDEGQCTAPTSPRTSTSMLPLNAHCSSSRTGAGTSACCGSRDRLGFMVGGGRRVRRDEQHRTVVDASSTCRRPWFARSGREPGPNTTAQK